MWTSSCKIQPDNQLQCSTTAMTAPDRLPGCSSLLPHWFVLKAAYIETGTGQRDLLVNVLIQPLHCCNTRHHNIPTPHAPGVCWSEHLFLHPLQQLRIPLGQCLERRTAANMTLGRSNLRAAQQPTAGTARHSTAQRLVILLLTSSSRARVLHRQDNGLRCRECVQKPTTTAMPPD